jgi:hypothetical protein
MIAIYCQGSHRNWNEHISDLMFALRTATTETTGYSPAELNFGRRLRKPSELYRESGSGEVPEFETHSCTEKLQQSLRQMLAKAAEAQKKASARQDHYYNLRRREVNFPRDTLVWRRNFPRSDAGEYAAAKLEPKYVGPYLIRGKDADSFYELITPEGKPSA